MRPRLLAKVLRPPSRTATDHVEMATWRPRGDVQRKPPPPPELVRHPTEQPRTEVDEAKWQIRGASQPEVDCASAGLRVRRSPRPHAQSEGDPNRHKRRRGTSDPESSRSQRRRRTRTGAPRDGMHSRRPRVEALTRPHRSSSWRPVHSPTTQRRAGRWDLAKSRRQVGSMRGNRRGTQIETRGASTKRAHWRGSAATAC